jgi:V/A-type H+-transporting ATPase subunit D
MKYQLNKPALQKLRRDLAIRLRALPILKAKETALRLEVTKSQALQVKLEAEAERLYQRSEHFIELWTEYPGLLRIDEIRFSERSVAGVPISIISEIRFHVLKAGLFHQRGWVVKGTEVLKEMVRLRIEADLARKNTEVLERARKKATQKVNLYEKVQIPQYTNAIRRIRSFLDDKENISRAAQRIVKARARQAVEP